MRVDPAALRATSQVFAAIAPLPASPAGPASTHPVAVAAAAQLNAHAANVLATFKHAAALAERASATYALTASDYEVADAAKVVAIANFYNEAADKLSGVTTPRIPAPEAPPAIAVPPHPADPTPVPHPPDPQAAPSLVEAAAAALESGDQGASLATMAETWRGIAAAARAHGEALDTAAAGLERTWDGITSVSALARLKPFAQWFSTDAADAALAVAAHAERLSSAQSDALSEHPTAQYVASLRQNYAKAYAAAEAGNAAAAKQATEYHQLLTDAQAKSTSVVQAYATHAAVPAARPPVPPSPVTPAPSDSRGAKPDEGRGDSHHDELKKPKASGDKDSDHETLHEVQTKSADQTPATGHTPAAEVNNPAAVKPPKAPDAPAVDDMSAPPMPMVGNLGQGLGQAGQLGQGMSPPQMPQAPSMPQVPQTPPMPPMSPPSAPSGGQGGGTPPVSPASTGGPVPPISPIGSAGGGAGPAGGGAGGPTPLTGLAPATALTTGTSSTPGGPAGPSTGVSAGMPMGMMPHGQGGSGKEKERDADLAPDQPLYVEDRLHSPAFDGTIGSPPPSDHQEEDNK
ncbi:PPE domain-containing protein [Mycobacteroides abscessus]|uniref:PPE domain-containing protein n=1 Tax=Mycobacteroides abscessus TaxID=36809 RepID=UPI002103D842|nr:PPE domain-containing protein [Mycobacteroides abscessus]